MDIALVDNGLRRRNFQALYLGRRRGRRVVVQVCRAGQRDALISQLDQEEFGPVKVDRPLMDQEQRAGPVDGTDDARLGGTHDDVSAIELRSDTPSRR